MGDRMREEFEAAFNIISAEIYWSAERGCYCSLNGRGFEIRDAIDATLRFEGWEASRAALVVELPESHSADEYMGFTRVIREADIESAIEAAGIKVKS